MTIFQEYLAGVEDSMQALSENEYRGTTRRLWAPLVLAYRETQGRTAFLNWLLTTAKLRDAGQGGTSTFESMAAVFSEVEVSTSKASLQLKRSEFEDAMAGVGKDGINVAQEWAEQVGGAIAYWPQERAGEILRRGHLAESAGGFTAYDGKPFFASDHPVNPFALEHGTYSNIVANKPIDPSVTLDVAKANFADVCSHLGAIKMPHGESFRALRPRAILAPPKLATRAREVGGLAAVPVLPADATIVDVADAANMAGFQLGVSVPELSGFEDETTYFVACEQVGSSELGAIVHLEREPYAIQYHGRETSAELSRRDLIEWHVTGRNKIAPGHPFLLVKVTGTE